MIFERQLTSCSSHLPQASRKPPEPILRLRKCLIRSLFAGDAEALAREANNPGIARWMRNTFPQPYRIDDAVKWISIASSASPMRDFAICRLDNNTVIGSIGLKTQDDIYYRTMQIGYWLGEDHWHQGIASEAISVFTDWTFERFKHVLRLEAEVFEGNDASARVLEKAGYKCEAERKNAIEKMGAVMGVRVYCKFRHGY